ncbi:MAG: hypothetical protein AMXMBFR82_21310 [Candidatus Hydrogenedentota bacterium]
MLNQFIFRAAPIVFLLCADAVHAEPPESMRAAFGDPPVSCRPHTRWWWMGNALSKDDITWQLEQMRAHGIGGVEQISMQEVYEKGNHPYLSPEYLELLRHAVDEAERLGMEFSLNFGGPGWIFGGDFVPQEERNQNLLASSFDIEGGKQIEGPLSEVAALNPRDARSRPDIKPDDRLVAVVAGELREGSIVESSLTVLTDHTDGRTLRWDVPEGTWRIMAFWLTYVDEGTVVDHLNEAAMTRYFDHVGSALESAVGDAFGTTIESMFSDSFEVPIHRNGIYWNQHLLEKFREFQGYDLTPYLPALWWKVDDVSPKIRYDVNEFLHHTGIEAFFIPMLAWCAEHNVKARIQPYGFVTDNIEGAGIADLPEMEISAGEKDAVPWFDTRIGPKKYVASGAHLYGRNIVTVEAYTYQHWEPYRATLEELKIASDIFLRSGANKFYNHGYTGIPERGIAPTRGFYAAIHISHDNVWWPYYPKLSEYLSRCCYLLRQGAFTSDVAIYSPLANQWALDALNARRWTRDFDWGELGHLLIANGYDFDLINDDVFQNRTAFEGEALRVGENAYRFLILPNIESMPLESLERVREYVEQGGTVIALERTPQFSTGFQEHRANDEAVRKLAGELFADSRGRLDDGCREFGAGRTYLLRTVIDRSDVLDRQSSALDPFLKVLRKHLAPDFGIDFVRMAWRDNPGLTFVHRRDGERDIYFVTNVQEHAIDMPIAFRVSGKTPWSWDPQEGTVRPIHRYVERNGATEVPIRLAPYASTFVVFEPGNTRSHVTYTNAYGVSEVTEEGVELLVETNGEYAVQFDDGGMRHVEVNDVPAPFVVGGPWRLGLEGEGGFAVEKTLHELTSWTDDSDTRHFSGTGQYVTEFKLPDALLDDDLELRFDAGDVGNIAEVAVNGRSAGVVWMRGQTLDVSDLVREGINRLEIRVTNTLINRVAGLTEPPPVPEELRDRLGAGTNDSPAAMARLMRFEPLPRSGLLGPVTIQPLKRVTLLR